MKFQFSTGLIIFAFAFTFNITKVRASIPIMSCDSCSASQMKQQVEQKTVSMDRSSVVVFDYRNEIARKFEVNYQLQKGKPIVTASPLNFTAEEQHDVELYFEYRKALADILRAGQEKTPYSIDEGGPSSVIKSLSKADQFSAKESAHSQISVVGEFDILGSPYEYMQTSSIRNDIYDHYMSGGQDRGTGTLEHKLQEVDIPTFKTSGMPLQLNFFKLNGDGVSEPNGYIIVEINTALERLETLAARDGDNNSIPITRAAAQGQTFMFTDAARGEEFKSFITIKYTSMTCALIRKVGTDKGVDYYQCS